MNRSLVVILFFVLLHCSNAAERQWIFFRDKGPNVAQQLSSAQRAAATQTISRRAMLRRAKSLTTDRLVDAQDLPLYQPYLDSLAQLGIAPVLTLRWFNAITAPLSEQQIAALRAKPFVLRVTPVHSAVLGDRGMETPNPIFYGMLAKPAATATAGDVAYGNAAAQVQLSRIDSLQALGITGNDVLLGMLDTGARWRNHAAMTTAHVINEYDFIQHDSITANQAGDSSYQDSHGTLTFSTICGWLPDTLIGGAFNASFLLAKTEYVPTETHIEEDNFAAALEWMEGQGVDVTSSSLGYSIFDSGQTSYTYADMNGHTTIVAKAMERAVYLGVCCVTAAGNEGTNQWNYIISPADVDTAITVGAVDSGGILAPFSSRGPTSDGRIKPDVCAMGVNTFGASTSDSDNFEQANGTSLATPMMASCAALLLSAHPRMTNLQVRNALRASGDHATTPDTAYGWGVANVYSAAIASGAVISNPPRIVRDSATGAPRIVCAIVASDGIKDDSVFLMYAKNSEKVLYTVNMSRLCASNFFAATLNNTQPGDTINYYIRAHTGTGNVVNAPNAVDGGIIFHAGDTTDYRTSPLAYEKACVSSVGMPIALPANDTLMQNFPNPFSTSTSLVIGISGAQRMALDAYNILGEHLATLYTGGDAGYHTITWNAENFPNGIYFMWLHGAGVSRNVLVRKAQ